MEQHKAEQVVIVVFVVLFILLSYHTLLTLSTTQPAILTVITQLNH